MTARLAVLGTFAAGLGVGAAALLGLWEPGWGIAAGVLLLIATLSAGVLRDPDGPEIHIFLALALCITAGFGVTTLGIALSELDHAAHLHDVPVVRAEIERFVSESWPKWVAMLAPLPVGGAVLVYRARILARRR